MTRGRVLLFVAVLLTSVLTAAYATRLWALTFLGPAQERQKTPWLMWVPLVLLAVAACVTPVGPRLLTSQVAVADREELRLHRGAHRVLAHARALRAELALRDGEVDRARELAEQALALWRGPAFADVAYEDFARGEGSPALSSTPSTPRSPLRSRRLRCHGYFGLPMTDWRFTTTSARRMASASTFRASHE